MTKYFSHFYFLTSIIFVILLLGKLGIYLSKKVFSFFFRPNQSFLTPFGLLFFLKNYLVIFGTIFLGANIYISGIDATFTKKPQILFAQEEYEYEIPYEELHYEALAQEETSYEVDLPLAPEEPTYAYPEPEQSYSEALLPEAQPDQVIAYPGPQIEQYSYVELLPTDDIPQYAYQAPQYEESSTVADLPPAEEVPTYAYQEPIYEQPVVAELPGHTDMPQDSDQADHQVDMNPGMAMAPDNTNHQQMPTMNPNMITGNGVMVMDTPHNPGLMDTPSQHNVMSPVASHDTQITIPDHNSMPVMNPISHQAPEMPGIDMSPGAHQMVMPSGHTENVMVGHSGSDTMTIPTMSHDQLTNINSGHTETHNSENMIMPTHNTTSDHTSMNMGSAQMTIPSDHHITSGNNSAAITMTDHSSMIMTSPVQTIVNPNNHSDHTVSPSFGSETSTMHHTTATVNNPATEHLTQHTTTPTFGTGTPAEHHPTSPLSTNNPTYNAFHNSHPTTQTPSTDHNQHTKTDPKANQSATDHAHSDTISLIPNAIATTHDHPSAQTTNPVVTSATTDHNTHTSTSVTPTQPSAHTQHSETSSPNPHNHPVVVSSEQTNIRELPKTGISASVLLLATLLPTGILYLKRNNHSTEIITANSIWSEKQLKL